MSTDLTFATAGTTRALRVKALRTVTVIGTPSGYMSWCPSNMVSANENHRGNAPKQR